jgi:hypothetical protein
MMKIPDPRHGLIVSAQMKLNTAREYISTVVDRMRMATSSIGNGIRTEMATSVMIRISVLMTYRLVIILLVSERRIMMMLGHTGILLT